MTLSRAPLPLVLTLLAGLLVAASLTSVASAKIADEPCPTVAGEHTNTCPPGTEGVFYSIQFLEGEGSGCGPGKQTWHLDSGALPPGLTLTTSGRLSGTPTQAGVFRFYLQLREPTDDPENCRGDSTEKQFTLVINPGLARLVIGPESTTPGTTGAAYSLQMTATVAEPKTWSINSGSLPPGLTINSSTGRISGTPTAAGLFNFVVLARMASDTRQDTKGLGIVIRDPLAIFAEDPFTTTGSAMGEVSVPFEAMLTATGGDGTYTWTLAAGTLPPGLELAQGALAGTPRRAGVFRFSARVTDAEGRVADYPARVVIAPKLAVVTRLVKPGRVDRFFLRKLATRGGIRPALWRVARGPLPRGVWLDRGAGVLYGYPMRAGVFRVRFEATDTLGVKAYKMLRIVIVGAPTKRK